jgi:hypothetical protein
MAIFCETLAETAVVAEACEAAGKHSSGAYALRRRNPYFAAAWDAALTIARERLADTLLARSMEGNIEQIWRDGEVVGERHLLDNRLGLAILKRLDRLAERDSFPGAGRGPGQRETAASQHPAPGLRREPFDWKLAIDALRTGDEASICKALALVENDKVEEVEDHPFFPGGPDDGPEEIDLSHRFWSGYRDDEKTWFTDFPPPAGFTGYEGCDYGDPDEKYERECTPEEAEILEGDATRAKAAERAEEEELRDSWLALLKADLASPPRHSGLEPQPACRSHGGDEARRQRDEGEEEIRQVPDRVRDDGPPGAVRTDRPRDHGHEATAAAPFNPASSPRPPSQAAADGP